ncbi:MAG: TatD family hydrolase [Candidatus Uhrbacteria bacterium]|nr:TatD family hydrolase [Candidatus Uhrbacteria bacterium]MDP3793781.1 TatD family hydrolase [Candidatus Uhrbacteria bacterium]
MSPFLVDTHCHLHFPPYDEDRDAVLARMLERDIWGITIGTALGNSERGICFAEDHPNVWATVGLHPEHVTSDFQDPAEGAVVNEHQVDETRLEALARSSKKVVAIGETGLDFYRLSQDDRAGREAQEKEFLTHVRVAHRLHLPLVIHCRQALGRLAEIVQKEIATGQNIRGVVHSFTGTWEEAKPLLDLGLHIAVNGIATFPSKKGSDPEMAIDRTIERIPAHRLLLETDAPYLAPVPFRGKRNEPAYVEEVAKHVAKVRGITIEEIARITSENAMTLFENGD